MNVRMRIAGIILAVIMGSIGPLGTTVSAYTFNQWYRPGRVIIQQVIGSHEFSGGVGGGLGRCTAGCYYGKLSDAGTKVNRSPASSGAQNIVSQYSIAIFDQSVQEFVPIKYQTFRGTVPAGIEWIQMPGLSVQPNNDIGHHVYQVTQTIWWKDSNGTVLGIYRALMNTDSDYACQSSIQRCTKNNSSSGTGIYLPMLSGL